MPNYTAAVIGLGRMGSTFDDEVKEGGTIFLPYCHAPSYVAFPQTRLVAGADTHEGQRAAFGQRWGIGAEHLYADYREMLDKERPDVVSVCTSTRPRCDIVCRCAEVGVKAIWAEKPLCFSLREADRMIDTCREHGAVLLVNCARRWSPLYAVARELIDAGEIGDVLQVTAYGHCGLSHNGSHLLDTVRHFARGEVRWVFGEASSDEAAAGDLDFSGNGYLAFDNGVRALARGTSCGPVGWEFEVLGTRGALRALHDGHDFLWRQVDETRSSRKTGTVVKPFPRPARMEGMGLTILRDLVSAMEKGTKPRCSGEDGRAALEIALAIRESHRRGGVRVNLPLENRDLQIISSEAVHDSEPVAVRRQKASAKS